MQCLPEPEPITSFLLSRSPDSTPLELAAVCRTWRATALKSHRLWTSISLFNPLGMHLHDMAREWLGRAGSLPLCIQFYSAWQSASSDLELLHHLCDLIEAYSGRWRFCNFEWFHKVFSAIYSQMCAIVLAPACIIFIIIRRSSKRMALSPKIFYRNTPPLTKRKIH